MKHGTEKALEKAEAPKALQVTVTLDQRSREDLDNCCEIVERKTGCVPSRSAVIRAALKAWYEAIK